MAEESAKNPGEEQEQGAPEASEPRSSEPQAVDPKTIRDRNKRIRAEAAEKRRRQREGTPERRRAASARNLDAGEIVDDALARGSHAAWEWLKKNATWVQWVVVLLVGAGIGWKIYTYRQDRNRAADTEWLAKAVAAENGRIGSGAAEPDRYTGLIDNRPVFATAEERSKAAEAEYRKAASNAKGGPTAALAELGLAGVLYDQGKFAEAKTAYEKARDSDLAKIEPDAKGRAIEGVALSLEALGQRDQALTEFKRLENSDIPGFGPLGMFHQARLAFAKGERDQAKELLKKCLDKLKKSDDKSKAPAFAPPGYLEGQAKDLLQAIDPKAPELASPAGAASLDELMRGATSGPGGKIDAAKLQEMLKKLGGAPGLPKPAPAPAPEAPAPAPEPAGSTP
ncbi:MAG: tetratricopeptide repeat protein [Myxococcota bacterium]|nr:tetratricopeptide repeat protein [Myxococcota bacterium]